MESQWVRKFKKVQAKKLYKMNQFHWILLGIFSINSESKILILMEKYWFDFIAFFGLDFLNFSDHLRKYMILLWLFFFVKIKLISFTDTSNPNSDVGDLKMFKDSMDVTNPAMVGHSFGGATTLMALGQKSALINQWNSKSISRNFLFSFNPTKSKYKPILRKI